MLNAQLHDSLISNSINKFFLDNFGFIQNELNGFILHNLRVSL